MLTRNLIVAFSRALRRSAGKRLNDDAAGKAASWKLDFGLRQVVPSAVLSGVYKIQNLLDAQDRGLTVFWAHDLKPLTEWISKTKS